MTTGMHVVCDVFCLGCMACLGWQYVCAFEKSQKYKEGKVILERACVVDYDRSSALARRSSSCSSASSGATPTISSPSMLAMDDQDCESGSEDDL